MQQEHQVTSMCHGLRMECSFEDGALNVHNGVVKSSYTGLNQIQPQEVPQVETEPADPAT